MRRFLAAMPPWTRRFVFVGWVLAPILAIWFIATGQWPIAVLLVAGFPFTWLMSRVWNKNNPVPPDTQSTTS
jgi:hypothetical protein